MKQVFRFLTVGFFNTLLGYCIIFAFMYLAKISPEISNVLGYGICLFISYALHRNFTFNSNQLKTVEVTRFLVVFLIAYASNFVVLLILIHKLALNEGLSQVMAGIFYVATSFIMNKYYVFKTSSGAETAHNSNEKITKIFNTFTKKLGGLQTFDEYRKKTNSSIQKMSILRFIKIFYVQKNIFVLVTLFVLWCIFLWNAFGADRSFALWMDNEFFIGTVLSSMSVTLSNGEWPLRMDTILGGVPLYNFAQLSPFYPFYLTVLPIYNSPLDVVHSMHWVTLVHILILEINMYIFLRVIGVSRIAALTGAALVAFSANSFAYAVWMNIVAPYSWLPLYLAGLIGILKCPRSIVYSAMALTGIVLLTLASPAQPLIHAVFITLVLVTTYWRNQLRVCDPRLIRYSLGRVVVVGVLALLLVAPVIVPATLEFKNMIRWIGPFPAVVGNSRIPFAAFQWDQLKIADLGGVLFKLKSAGVGSQFVGVIPIALASVAVVSRPRSWLIVALAFIAVYSLISSMGSNLGLAYLNYIIPILNKIREPSRFLVLFQLAVGTLAAFGIDELRKMVSSTEDPTNTKRQLIALVGTAVVAVIALLVVWDHVVSNISPLVSIAILVALILMTWAAKHSNLRGRSTFIGIVWGCTTLIMLAIEVPWIPPSVSNSQYLTTGALSLDKAIERISILDPNHEYRVVFDGKIDKQQASMLASYQGVRSFNMYFNPAPLRQFEELYYHGPRADNYFRILGAKYLICNECKEESLLGYKYLESIAGYQIYMTEDVLPRSYIVHQLNGNFLNLADFVAKAASADLTKKLLFVEPSVVAGINRSSDAAEDDCISREDIRTANRTRFVIQCKSAGVLVMNEFFDDAWVVRVDGVKIQKLRVNGNQIGAAFTSGTHVIEFQYLPTIFLVSLILALGGLMLLIYLTVGRNFLMRVKQIN
jgi:putative flippase GtrA